MSETFQKILWILIILFLVGSVIFSLPFNIYINILVVIGVIILGIVLLGGLMYAVASGLGARGQAIKDSWGYREKMKSKSWDELSEDEQKEMLSSYLVIDADCGGTASIEEIKNAMKEQLPILTPQVGLSFRYTISEETKD